MKTNFFLIFALFLFSSCNPLVGGREDSAIDADFNPGVSSGTPTPGAVFTSTPIPTATSIPNNPPVTVAISPPAFTEDNQSADITLSYSDVEGDLATSCTISALANVTVTQACSCTVGGVCTVRVTGTSNFNNSAGTASFGYTVTANGSTSNVATATLSITAVDDAPVAVAISPAAFNEDTQSADITLSYSDVDGNLGASCTISALANVTVTQACSCTVGGVCTVRVTGTSNFNNSAGTASFGYTVTANGVASNVATATLSITAVDDAPVTSAIAAPAVLEEAQTADITLGYTDVDSDLATSCAITALSHVTVTQACSCTVGGVCTVRVTGDTDYYGTATFNYTVTANGAVSNASTVTMTITNVNDAPVISAIAAQSTNEDVAKAVTFTITDSDNTLVCSSANLSMSSSDTAIVANASVVWSGTAPNCTGTITPVANAYGAPTITITVTDGTLTANSAFVLTVTRLADDAFTGTWPFTAGTDASYTFDTTKIDLTGGVARLTTIDQTDDGNTASGFAGGTHTGTSWDATNGYLRLTQTGTPTNNSSLDSTWTPQWSSLTHYWSMDNTWVDSIGASNGTATGATFTTSSKIGTHAGNFGGADYVRLPSITFGSAVTVSAWVKSSSLAAINSILGGCSDANSACTGDYKNIQLYINTTGTVFFGIAPADHTSRATDGVTASAQISTGNWYHVVGTIDSSTNTTKIYINGQSVPVTASNTGAGAFGAYSITADIGANYIDWNTTNVVPITGAVDELGIWSVALSAVEVQTLYDRQSAKYAGIFSSRIMDVGSWGAAAATWTSFAWVPTLPFFKELTDYTGGSVQNETTANYTSLASSTLMTGIVGEWHMNETSWAGVANEVVDDSGKTNHGISVNGATTTAAGRIGYGGNFDGTNDYVSITDSATLSPTAALTVSTWVNVSVPTISKVIAQKWSTGGTQNSWAFGTLDAADRLSVVIANALTDVTFPTGKTPASTFTPGWHHVAFTYDGSQATNATKLIIYIDGVAQTLTFSAAIAASLTDSTSPVIFGSYGGIGLYWNGRIDEAAMWSRALTSTEILQLYRRGANRIKYQVRSCDDNACSGEIWKGTDNTIGTYFSEFNNNTVPNDGTGNVQNGLPTLSFSSFGSLSVANNEFFQYRTIIESDDVSTNCNYGSGVTWCSPELKSATVGPTHYDGSAPTIYNNTGVDFYTLNAFAETLGASCAGGARYTLSLNKTNWYYWTGAAWGVSNDTYAQANSAATVNTNTATFSSQVGTGNIYFKAFMNSSGIQPCELDLISIGGNQ